MNDADATALVENENIEWHQRFMLSPNVMSPGRHDICWLLDQCTTSNDVSGKTALDIGTCNGGAALTLSAWGAYVTANDLPGALKRFGTEIIFGAAGANIPTVEADVIQLPKAVGSRQFDIVLFLGVLYHLRHPLLSLEAVRELTSGEAYIETAVCPDIPDVAHAEFHATSYRDDSSNWFVPSVRCLEDWVASCGFEIDTIQAWPKSRPERALVIAH